MTMENRKDSHSGRDGKLWPTIAVCALLLCGWMAVSKRGSEVRADNGGATTAGIIAMMGIQPNNEHLFIIDTNFKTIMMYEIKNGQDLNFVAGRSFDNDSTFLTSKFVPGKFLKYKQAGYEDEVAKYVASIGVNEKK